jgi:hypothetical protein
MLTSWPSKRGAGKGGIAVLWRAGRACPALPDRERWPTSNVMRKILTLTLTMLAVGCLGQEPAVSTRRILPEDVAQDSIQLFRFSTNSFAVRWTYTEAGAKKALAFWEAHPSPGATYSAQWKEGWLKRRTDKGFFKTEDTAKAFMAELKSK